MSTDTTDVTAGTANPFDALDPAPVVAVEAAVVAPAAPADPDAPDAPVEGEEALGDAGKQALDRMKERLRNERAARLAAEQRLNEATPATDAERIQREADAKATAKANQRILSAEVRAAATGKLSDPTDALTFIDLSDFDVDDEGSVDQDAIAEAIADLVRRKPYLAAQGGPKTPKPDPSQGGAGGATATTADRFANSIDGLI